MLGPATATVSARSLVVKVVDVRGRQFAVVRPSYKDALLSVPIEEVTEKDKQLII